MPGRDPGSITKTQFLIQGLEWGFRFDASIHSQLILKLQFEQRNWRIHWGSKRGIHSFIHCLLIRLAKYCFPLLLERGGSYDIHELERIVPDYLIQMHRKVTPLPSLNENHPGSWWRGRNTLSSLNNWVAKKFFHGHRSCMRVSRGNFIKWIRPLPAWSNFLLASVGPESERKLGTKWACIETTATEYLNWVMRGVDFTIQISNRSPIFFFQKKLSSSFPLKNKKSI